MSFSLTFYLSRGKGNRRKGYMGHLTNVANSIVQSMEKGKNKAALETIFTGESLMVFMYMLFD